MEESKKETEMKELNGLGVSLGMLMAVLHSALTPTYPPPPTTVINIYSDKKVEVKND